MENFELETPLIDNEENIIIFKLISKCKKKIESTKKLENNLLRELNLILSELIEKLNQYLQIIATDRKEIHIQNLVVNLEAFSLFMKDKINFQINKLNAFDEINKKFQGNDLDEDTSVTLRIQSEVTNKSINQLKDVLFIIQRLDDLRNMIARKAPKITKRKFSIDEKDTYLPVKNNSNNEILNEDYRAMNKWIGFFSMLCVLGSISIFLTVLWKNAI